MLKSSRVSLVFAGLTALVLGVSQVVFAGGMDPQERGPAASNPQTSKSAGSQTKSSKKRKKKKAAAPAFVVLGTYSPQTSVS